MAAESLLFLQESEIRRKGQKKSNPFLLLTSIRRRHLLRKTKKGCSTSQNQCICFGNTSADEGDELIAGFGFGWIFPETHNEMEEESEMAKKGHLVFAANGQRFELFTVDPSMTLLEFLRTQTPFKSVKLGCGEGGCGACTVLLSKHDPLLDQVEDFTASSCLTLLCSINGCSITTSEGLGNSKVGFHSIHKRFSGFHASQCGFCTPGMCMSLFGALVNAEKTDRPEPSPGYSKLTVLEAEKAIAGNLCRCTGYRPIADACKSFASDVDMEDLGFNSFWKKGERHEVNISGLPLYNRNHEICTFPAFLKREVKASMLIDSKRCSWNQPSSFQELQGLLKSYDANNGVRMKLVVGNTGMGYYKEVEHYDRYIDLRYIPELSMIRGDHTGIEIGASVTISKAIEALREESKGEFISASKLVFKKIADHMEKVAAKFIRNIGSIGGNLVMAQGKHFPSDIATILLAAGSFVHIINGVIHEKLTLEEFLERPPLDSKSVLISVRIPNCGSIKDVYPEGDSKLFFETYRAAPRPLGNALPYLNAAFLAEVSCSKSSNGIMMNSCQLAFGAFGTKHAIRARKVEEFLTGNWLTNAVLCEAIKLVKATVVPDDGTSDPAYRSSLAVGFLFDFLGQLVDSSSNGWLKGYSGISMLEDVISKEKYDNLDHVKYPTLLSSSKQVIELNKEYHPIGEPITKSGSALQASGEAVYVDDIPSPGNCLYGSFIYSTKPFARIKGIGFNSKSLPDGVTALVSFKDIPKGGQNIGLLLSFGPERLFADELTQYAGEPVAFVLADSQKHADVGAKLAVVDYDLENLESPILTVEEAVERSSLFEIPPVICPKQVGDFSKGIAEADHKILSAKIKLGSQYYFYMENQTALAVPDEDNCMVVYSSIQCPEYAQAAIAKCLGVPEHNVRVLTRRVGGGFGGKVTKSMPVATACALAAHKYQRPVRISMNRKTDMIMAGGRHPMKITYSVGFKSNGKITALYLDILIDAGISLDISPMMPKAVVGALKKYNWGALSFDIKLCKTNLSSKSAMRGPGDLQGSYIAEAIIEQVASFLSVDADSVRAINFHTYDSLKLFYDVSAGDPLEYTLTSIWDKLATSACFNQRTQMIKEFNRYNIWKKRGISRIPCVYDVSMRPTPGKVSILHDGSIVVEVGGIELGQGLWTKVKQMAAFALSSIKYDGDADFLDKIRVIQADTLSLIQGGITAGSTTSESSCEAVRLCCEVLVERLMPLKERLQMQTDSIRWEMLIQKAYLEAVNLSVNSFFIPDFASKQYLNYGAAVSEVEVDLLTGQTTILRSDILYDCGQSLNPAVDLGQIEGAFVQGIGFFMLEEYTTNSDGLVDTEGTWTYKIPTIDTIPKQLNVALLHSGRNPKRVLSSKGRLIIYDNYVFSLPKLLVSHHYS
ncbi:indole-3-acetaldehyde oxidase isoform X3 [Hevea brasiliensis]|uniref:indole-3-acetaldehyde oxidase isoform X3 n=1 Tax=Hevea brasiliensis TaxID=3981 RepID=UPI0025FF6614|nr:indole-3-acetaldehyde oxidase isoform X3 [Hevea brasiliensis]